MVLAALVEHGQLVVVNRNHVIERDLTATQHVTCDVTAGHFRVYVARQHSAHWHTRQHVVILTSVSERTGQCHLLLHIDDALLEEPADKRKVLDVEREDRLTFRQRREVVQLHTDIAGRVRTKHLIQGAILQLSKLRSFGAALDTDEDRCQLAESRNGCLQSGQLTLQHELVVRGTRRTVKTRNKNSAWLLVRHRDAIVRTLLHQCPEAALQQQLLHVTCGVKFLVRNHGICRDVNGEDLTTVSTYDLFDFAAHRRGKEQALKRLVVKQRATRFHAIADFDIQLGCDAGELVGHYVKDLRPPYATQRLSRLSLKRNVQSTFQFDCLHK